MSEGWVCPKCERVNAPWVTQCGCTSPAIVPVPCPATPQWSWIPWPYIHPWPYPYPWTPSFLYPNKVEVWCGKVPGTSAG